MKSLHHALQRSTLNLLVIMLGLFFILGSGDIVITINGDNPVTVVQGSTYIDAGATAKDDDGDLDVITAGLPIDTSIVGIYDVTYTATGDDGETKAIRKVHVVEPTVVDIVAPVITITGSNPISILKGKNYTDAGATATDNVDPTIVVTSTSTVDTSTVGKYEVVYKAKDKAGNEATKKRIVNVVENKYTLKIANHALLGPLNGATVKVYKLTDLSTPIEETKTDELGSFKVSLSDIEDELLLVTVVGGSDVDSNDDGVLDNISTQNKGTIHAFAKANELKNNSVNVTLLSEIVYQYTKHLIGEAHLDDFEMAINMISAKLFKSKLGYKDINSFIPMETSSREKLTFDYEKLINDSDSLLSLYYTNVDVVIIEKKISSLFEKNSLSFRDSRLEDYFKYSKIIFSQAIKSNVVADGADIFINEDEEKRKLKDYVLKNNKVVFDIILKDKVKILGWDGCDSVSDDLSKCTLTVSDNNHRIVPNVVYKKTTYADNVRDVTNYQIGISNNVYTLTLDLDATSDDKSFVDSITSDDILMSRSPNNPFFKKIVSAEKIDDNNYSFKIKSASFLELYKEGSVFSNKNLTHEDLVSPSSLNRSALYRPSNGMRLLPPKHKDDDEFTIVFGEPTKSLRFGDTNHAINLVVADGVTIKGSMSFKLRPEFSYNTGFFSLESMRFAVGQEIKTKLVLEASKKLELDKIICKKLGKPVDCNEFLKTRLAKYNYWIPNTPIALNIELDFSLIVEAAIEGSVDAIGAEYTKKKKTGFNYVNGHLSVINDESSEGSIVGGLKPIIAFNSGQYIKLSPIVLINEIAGIELETKTGFYAEVGSVISASSSGLDFDDFRGKVDARFSAEFKWAWSDWLARFDWAKNLGEKINKKVREKTGGLSYVYSYNIYDWPGPGEKPAYLELTSPKNLIEIKKTDEFVDKHYVFNVKNTGEKDLNWKLNVSGDLKDDLSFSPKSGVISEGGNTNIDVYVTKNDLNYEIGKHKAYLKFVNLSNTDGSNEMTGTTTKKIGLNILQKINPPLNLRAELVGESIKNIKFDWIKSETEGVMGYTLYKSNYDSGTGTCLSNYINFMVLLDFNTFKIPFEFFENNQKEEYKMKAGEKYCFKVSAYSVVYDWLDTSINGSELSSEVILEIPNYATLKSNITDKNNSPIENARVYLTSVSTNTKSDGAGEYTFENLLPGRYKIVVEAEGYIRIEAEVTLIAGETKIFERQLVADDDLEEIEGTVAGKVQNALSGSGINLVTIDIRQGINILSGEIVETITTDSGGNYSAILKTGAYTFSLSADGYTSHSETIYSYGNETTEKDLSLSPILSEGNMRIVLGWGENPRDLDSHLVKKINGNEKYHIYYNNHNLAEGHSKTPEGDALDHDDIYNYGPETITIDNVDSSATYTYYVHHYRGSSDLKSSSAKVEVYYGDSSSTYNVTNEDGEYWKVFDIVNGQVVPCTTNCIQDSSYRSRSASFMNEFNIFNNLPNKD